MKKILLTIITISIIIISCKKENHPTEIKTPEDPNWIKMEIPNGGEAYAIAGNMDDTLLVTTKSNAYFTTDNGKTWQESKNFNGAIQGLYTSKDTVIALATADGLELDGTLKAVLPQYYTLDLGKSWNRYTDYNKSHTISTPIGITQSSTNQVTYRLKYNTEPVSANSTAYTHLPTDVLKNGTVINFPFKSRLYNLYLDNENRLYVAASGNTYNNNGGTSTCCTLNTAAVVYISRKPLP